VLFHRVVIAGVGLIGGSLALAARERGLFAEVVGCGRTEANLRVAKERGVVDDYTFDPQKAAARADLLVLAVPVEATASTAKRFLPFLPAGCVVTDAGSVKEKVVLTMEGLLPPSLPFVGGHPIAGNEYSGAGAAVAGLFVEKLCVLTPTARTQPQALAKVRALWEGVGMRVEEMAPEIHDRVLSRMSHLPHVLAFSAINAVVEAEGKMAKELLPYAGGAFTDLTRVAASPVEMWRDIFLANRSAVLAAMTEFQEVADRLKELIAAGNGEGLTQELTRAREARLRLARLREKG
jgi:prephenate dehydrogenase